MMPSDSTSRDRERETETACTLTVITSLNKLTNLHKMLRKAKQNKTNSSLTRLHCVNLSQFIHMLECGSVQNQVNIDANKEILSLRFY